MGCNWLYGLQLALRVAIGFQLALRVAIGFMDLRAGGHQRHGQAIYYTVWSFGDCARSMGSDDALKKGLALQSAVREEGGRSSLAESKRWTTNSLYRRWPLCAPRASKGSKEPQAEASGRLGSFKNGS